MAIEFKEVPIQVGAQTGPPAPEYNGYSEPLSGQATVVDAVLMVMIASVSTANSWSIFPARLTVPTERNTAPNVKPGCVFFRMASAVPGPVLSPSFKKTAQRSPSAIPKTRASKRLPLRALHCPPVPFVSGRSTGNRI